MYASVGAMNSVQAERASLLAARTYVPETVISKQDLIDESLNDKTPIVMGDLLTNFSVKQWEKPELRRHKGRICFRGDNAKDEYGRAACYQDLGASPAGIFEINVNIAFGSAPGNITTASDALRAYLQTKLGSLQATWVAIPEELWPEDRSWHREEFRNYGNPRPMCRLYKALYGHPVAGGHWNVSSIAP